MGVDDGEQCPECASWNIIVNEMKKQIVCRDCGGIFTIGQAGANAAVDVKVVSSSPAESARVAKAAGSARASKPAKKSSAKKKPKAKAKSAKAKPKPKPKKAKSKKGKKK